jgi:UDP-glucose:(heptosyl)LPS alpha-1,3-glucosyltransferase
VRIDAGAPLSIPASSPRPRLAVVTPFIDKRHGTERRVAECVSRLAGDFEIHVYSNRVEDVPLDTIVWHRIPALPGPHFFAYLWWFAANQFVRWRHRRAGLRFDAIYSPGINCLDATAVSVHVVFAELIERTAADRRMLANPKSSWPRILHRGLYYRLILSIERMVYPRKRVSLAVVSQKVAGELARHFHRTEDVRVVYHGMNLSIFSPEERLRLRPTARASFGFAASHFALLLIGNGWANKGLPCMIEALALLGNLPVRLIVAGNDDRAPYIAQARRLSIADRITFLPHSPSVIQYFAAADAYVGPSTQDSFALPPAEAMACGLPVITSRSNGGSEIITHGADGLILEDPSDSRTLAALIRSLVEDEKLRERLSANAAITARRFTWEENARQMRALFEGAIRLSRPS